MNIIEETTEKYEEQPPTTEKYEEFQQSMNEVEYQFISQIKNCITLNTTQL